MMPARRRPPYLTSGIYTLKKAVQVLASRALLTKTALAASVPALPRTPLAHRPPARSPPAHRSRPLCAAALRKAGGVV